MFCTSDPATGVGKGRPDSYYSAETPFSFNFRGRGEQGKEMPPRIEGNPRASWTQDRIADERNEKADVSEAVAPPGSILARLGDVTP